MALNIGTLTGFLDLDTSGFEAGADGALDRLQDVGSRGAKIAAAGGGIEINAVRRAGYVLRAMTTAVDAPA